MAKIMLLMCLSTMSTVYTGDVEIWLQTFKILTLNGSGQIHDPVTLLNREPLVHTRYEAGRASQLDMVAKRKISLLEINQQLSSPLSFTPAEVFWFIKHYRSPMLTVLFVYAHVHFTHVSMEDYKQ
jgi:hypothetical protein